MTPVDYTIAAVALCVMFGIVIICGERDDDNDDYLGA